MPEKTAPWCEPQRLGCNRRDGRGPVNEQTSGLSTGAPPKLKTVNQCQIRRVPASVRQRLRRPDPGWNPRPTPVWPEPLRVLWRASREGRCERAGTRRRGRCGESAREVAPAVRSRRAPHPDNPADGRSVRQSNGNVKASSRTVDKTYNPSAVSGSSVNKYHS